MKTIKTISSFLMISALILTSACSKGDDNRNNFPTPPATSGNMTAKVDGANYANSAYFSPAASLSEDMLNIQSSNDTGNSIQIQIPNFMGEGTYNSGDNNVLNGYINYSKLNSDFTITPYTSIRGNGSVIITMATDTRVEGTFSAYAPINEDEDTSGQAVTITEGSFSIAY